MQSGIRKSTPRLVALLLGAAMLPAYAADQKGPSGAAQSFRDHDGNRDGYLSLEEFKAKGKDDLAFRAADSDGDARLDRSEFDAYLARKANDQAKPDRDRPGN